MRVQVVLTCEWEVEDAGVLVGTAQVLAACSDVTLERDGVEGSFSFTPEHAQRAVLAARELSTPAEALEWLVLDAAPRELSGAWARAGAVAARVVESELPGLSPPRTAAGA